MQSAHQNQKAKIIQFSSQLSSHSQELIPRVFTELTTIQALICSICKKKLSKNLAVYRLRMFYCVGCFAKQGFTEDYQLINASRLLQKKQGWTLPQQLRFLEHAQRFGLDNQQGLCQSIGGKKSQKQVSVYIIRNLCHQKSNLTDQESKGEIKQKEKQGSRRKGMQVDTMSTLNPIDVKSSQGLIQIQRMLNTTEYDVNSILVAWLHEKSGKQDVDYLLEQQKLQKIESDAIYNRIRMMMRVANPKESISFKGVLSETMCGKQECNKQQQTAFKQTIEEQDLLARGRNFLAKHQEIKQRKTQNQVTKLKSINRKYKLTNTKSVYRFKKHLRAKQSQEIQPIE